MEPEKVVQLTPLIRRITAGNGSVFTGPGTNTYLVGNEEVTVIDPGPAMEKHIDIIIKNAKNIKQILVTHTHPDHSPGHKTPYREIRGTVIWNDYHIHQKSGHNLQATKDSYRWRID